jgi:hypothetical protein
VKTAISIPEPVFRSAEKAAKRLNVSRSQLYTAAVAAYVQRHAAAGVTESLDAVYAVPESSRLDAAIAAAQLRGLARERW